MLIKKKQLLNAIVYNSREQLDFVILDLIKKAQDKKVICDCHLTLEMARVITDPSRIVFMLRKPVDLVDDTVKMVEEILGL